MMHLEKKNSPSFSNVIAVRKDFGHNRISLPTKRVMFDLFVWFYNKNTAHIFFSSVTDVRSSMSYLWPWYLGVFGYPIYQRNMSNRIIAKTPGIQSWIFQIIVSLTIVQFCVSYDNQNSMVLIQGILMRINWSQHIHWSSHKVFH